MALLCDSTKPTLQYISLIQPARRTSTRRATRRAKQKKVLVTCVYVRDSLSLIFFMYAILGPASQRMPSCQPTYTVGSPARSLLRHCVRPASLAL